MIENMRFVESNDKNVFMMEVNKHVDDFQEEGFTVEIDYKPIQVKNSVITYTAMIIAKSETTKFNPNYRIGDE